MPGLELNTANHSAAAENVTAGLRRSEKQRRAPFISLFPLTDSKSDCESKESQQAEGAARLSSALRIRPPPSLQPTVRRRKKTAKKTTKKQQRKQLFIPSLLITCNVSAAALESRTGGRRFLGICGDIDGAACWRSISH